MAKLLLEWDRTKTKLMIAKTDAKFQDMFCNEVKLEDVPFCKHKYTVMTSVRAFILDSKYKCALQLAADEQLKMRFQLVETCGKVALQGEIAREVLCEFLLSVSGKKKKKKKKAEEVATEFTELVMEILYGVNLVLRGVLSSLSTCCLVKKRGEALNMEELEQATTSIMQIEDDAQSPRRL